MKNCNTTHKWAKRVRASTNVYIYFTKINTIYKCEDVEIVMWSYVTKFRRIKKVFMCTEGGKM